MSLNDEVTAVQRCLDDLGRALTRLESHLGNRDLELRRVRTDAAHLRESITLLRDVHPAERPRPETVPIPDAPYDASLWKDADEEGLGARDRRAP
ncbi:hypothetical protein AF335_25615 [Streptomyces eurocidicus]|uniref:Uncharacterized protein n=1 Tax=Streptomyces eurocidicus TaxID=66423 RepID=A0A2N8NRJ6_STREU|nr:hypothetical protein [Streptomyces eurocidicus]MBB5117219.1 hypothetical protein [Streptomyces eurocidicus]MBF6052489.1 hypothetical protein [Streptomyces eurocidicus]PNE31398.1 hypothetical protein AF335_25615 [Streptomyces eurocidicus]